MPPYLSENAMYIARLSIFRRSCVSRLTQERRKMLSRAIYMAFSERYGGKTEYLDELMK